MKTIGLIGGTSWHSTIDYYRFLNEMVNKKLGNNSSAKVLLYSVNFEEVAVLSARQDWDAVGKILVDAAKRLELAGADCLLLCANTMHINADMVQAAINIPLLHIADGVIDSIVEQKISSVLLLGTKYTMLSGFYSSRLAKAGITTVIPPSDTLEFINDSIYQEFGKGIFLPETKERYLGIIHDSVLKGAGGVILGCTELPIFLKKEDSDVPLFDTTLFHATAAVDFALANL